MKRILSLLLVLFIICNSGVTVFATNDYLQGTEIELLGAGTEQYAVTVPAKLTPGQSGTVTLSGTWATNRIINVTAEKTVTLINISNANDHRILDVTFAGISETGSDTDVLTFTETIHVSDIQNALFGTWSGRFYYNVEIGNYEISLPDVGKSAEEYTWDEIKAISEAGKAEEYFSIGDTKTIVAEDGTEIVVEVVGINEDTKADGSGVVGVTWASQITIEDRQMHPTTDINSWYESETRRWLQNDFYETLPDEIKAVVVPVNKTYYDNSDKTTKTCVDTLWIPSYREIFGNPNNNPNFETEGPDYTEFFNSENARVRYTLDGSDAYWWVRTAAFNRDIGYFYSVNKISYYGKATLTAGILLCFCT